MANCTFPDGFGTVQIGVVPPQSAALVFVKVAYVATVTYLWSSE